MCLIFVAHRHVPGFPLVVAANRDEFYERPTRAAGYWDEAPQVLAGRDLLARGTWLGVTRGGRFAALTNYRSGALARRDAPSRGQLVSRFLLDDRAPLDYLAEVARDGERYNGFSLLAGDGERLGWYSNRGGAPRALGPGLYGQSNHLLDTPWPKVVRGKRRLGAALAAPGWTHESLLDLMFDRDVPRDEDLPDTGIERDWERELAPMFITGASYGTRSTTVLSVTDDAALRYVERTYRPHVLEASTVRYDMALGAPPARGAARNAGGGR